MVKTLRITSILVAIVAIGLLAFPFFFGFRRDDAVEAFLSTPSVLEKLSQANTAGSRRRNKVSPLVSQARALARILNPPAPPPRRTTVGPRPPVDTRTVEPPPPPRPPTTFALLGTSYNASNPAESLALVDVPGKGVHWVRQSGRVGHFTLQIHDGYVVATGGAKTVEVRVKHKPEISLLQAGSSSATPPPATGSPVSGGAVVASSSTPVSRAVRMSPEEIERQRRMADEIFAQLEAKARESAAADGGSGQQAALDEIFAQLKARTKAQSGKIAGDAAAHVTTPPAPAPAPAKSERITRRETSNLRDLGRKLDKTGGSGDATALREKQRELRRRRAEAWRKRIEAMRAAKKRATQSKSSK